MLSPNNEHNIDIYFWGTLFHKERWTLDWHLYRCGKARSHPVIKALTLGKKVWSSVIFWQGSEHRAKQYSYMLGSSWKKNDCMFDCLIARLYLQAIVFSDSNQSCVHNMCVCVCVCFHVIWKCISTSVAMTRSIEIIFKNLFLISFWLKFHDELHSNCKIITSIFDMQHRNQTPL